VARLLADEGIMAALPILGRAALEWRPGRERTRRIKADSQGPLTTEVDVSRWVTDKQAALAEHRTQIRRDPMLRYVAVATERFTVRESRVEVHPPETDLFAGLR
jgi:LmbE family N-acetylglucosaminyl deacetylase